MRTTLMALHGYTLHADVFRRQLAPLLPDLEPLVDIDIPDAPFLASPEGVARLHAGRTPPPGPHRTWWDASDDGQVYAGFETTRAALAERIAGRTLVLGFSQGAILAATLAALSATGGFPILHGVILVAGRRPRDATLRPLFDTTVQVPSLHLWGDRDPLADGPGLADCFHRAERVAWPGGHVVPTRGPGAAALVAFVSRHG